MYEVVEKNRENSKEKYIMCNKFRYLGPWHTDVTSY